MSGNKFTVLVLAASLLIGPSFLGGVDLLARHFCTLNTGGLCGLLQGMAASLNHLGSIHALFVFLAPSVFAALIFLFLSYRHHSESSLYTVRRYTPPVPAVCVTVPEERFWLTLKTNSPNNTR